MLEESVTRCHGPSAQRPASAGRYSSEGTTNACSNIGTASRKVSSQCTFPKQASGPFGSQCSQASERSVNGCSSSRLLALRAAVLRRAISQWRGSTLRAALLFLHKLGGVCWRTAKHCDGHSMNALRCIGVSRKSAVLLFRQLPNPSVERTSNGGPQCLAPSRSATPLAAAHLYVRRQQKVTAIRDARLLSRAPKSAERTVGQEPPSALRLSGASAGTVAFLRMLNCSTAATRRVAVATRQAAGAAPHRIVKVRRLALPLARPAMLGSTDTAAGAAVGAGLQSHSHALTFTARAA